MKTIKTRRFLIVVLTGIASPLLLLTALLKEGTDPGLLSSILFGPGHFVTSLFSADTPQTHHSPLYFQIAFALDFVFIWMVLLAVALLLEKLFTRGK